MTDANSSAIEMVNLDDSLIKVSSNMTPANKQHKANNNLNYSALQSPSKFDPEFHNSSFDRKSMVGMNSNMAAIYNQR